MQTPKKVAVREEPEGPVFIYRWQDWGMILPLLFGLIFFLFPLWLIFNNLDLPVIALFLLLFSAIGFGISYWSLGRVINRTEIRLQQGRMLVRHRPFPWRYNADLPVGELQAISQETYFNRSRDSGFGGGLQITVKTSYRNERLVAHSKDGKSRILIPRLELAAAEFLSQEVEARLGLRQALTDTERVVSLQASQQEQKRVEASQVKMLLPIFILMAPLLIVAGIAMLIGTYNAQREARLSLSWPSAEGQASGYTVTRHVPDSDDNWDTYYSAAMEYTYMVGGQAYTIEKAVSETFDSEQKMAQFVETNYPPGTPLTVYYNPAQPRRALYDRSGPGSFSFVMAGVALGAGLLALITLIATARYICKVEGCPDDWKHWNFWLRQVPFVGRLQSG